MDAVRIGELIKQLARLDYSGLYLEDFFLTWDKTEDEIRAVFLAAEILRGLRRQNISARIFDSGLGISLFRDQSTRTRFSFASACNLLGLEVQDLEEGKFKEYDIDFGNPEQAPFMDNAGVMHQGVPSPIVHVLMIDQSDVEFHEQQAKDH